MSKLSVNFHDAGFTPAIVLVNQITGNPIPYDTNTKKYIYLEGIF